ncbi:MAG: hypothetical protein E7554_09795 [Ruminococcaceae bacterium]|nr:hypothetical protein [Oscillospiraceae bacterium]
MNTSKLKSRCRFLSGVLAAVFLAVTMAVCLRVWLFGQEQQRLDSFSRGTIYDRTGEVIAMSEPGRQAQRTCTNGQAASALVGYVSREHGSDGIERLYDSWLAPAEGDDTHGDIRLTVDSRLQQVCLDSILGAQAAGAVVMDIETGAILASVDTPSFDPAELEEDYEGVVSRGCVFYNICAGSGVTPGDMFLLPSCCAAVRAGDTNLAQKLIAGEAQPEDIAGIRRDMSGVMSRRLLVGQTIELDCMTLRSGTESTDGGESTDGEYLDALMGYGSARLSPMQVCMYTAALAREDGSIVKPCAVDSMVSRSGVVTDCEGGEILSRGAFNAEAKIVLAQLFETCDAAEGSFSAMTASSASGSNENIWLTAYYPSEDPRYALTIIMQNEYGAADEDDALAAARKIIESLD